MANKMVRVSHLVQKKIAYVKNKKHITLREERRWKIKVRNLIVQI